MTQPAVSRPAVLVENTLGHATFLDTLRKHAAARQDLDPLFLPLPTDAPVALDSLPLASALARNYTVRLSLTARSVARRQATAADALVVHTQTAAYLLKGVVGPRPLVISGDGTPLNLDEVAEGYAHRTHPERIEHLKVAVMRRVYLQAAAVVMFSQWAADSAVRDYRIPSDRVHVVHPGVPVPRSLPVRAPSHRPPRLLFIGGDFERKGGDLLLDVLGTIDQPWELDIVTRDDVPAGPRVRVHRGVTPNSHRLHELLAQADLMVLPTAADMFSFASMEAMAAGLPVITTAVGGIGELVQHGVTGILVAPHSTSDLRHALVQLLEDPQLRLSYGEAGFARVREHFNADVQSRRYFDHVQAARRPLKRRQRAATAH